MSHLANLPIRGKLMMIIMGVSLSVLLLASLAFIRYDIGLARQAMVQEVSTLARLLGNRSSAALVFQDPTLALENLQALSESPNVIMGCLYETDGTQFALYDQQGRDGDICPPVPAGQPADARFAGGHLHVHSPIKLGQDIIGHIYLRAHLQGIDDRLRKQTYAALLIALTAALAAYLLSNLVQRLISTPLIRMAETATTIEREQDYSLRVPEYGRDELGTLSRSLNAMLDTIERQNRQLLAAKENLESVVAERTRELQTTNRELEAFVYSVSHDLRAPLRAINGFSQAVMEGEANLDPDSRNYLTRVCRASVRMEELINALLMLSRTSRQEMYRTRVDISKVARECLQELSDSQPGRGVSIRITPDLMVDADPGLLRILMHNLLSNAWKFTRDREEARIEFGRELQDGKPVFFVRDNGAGFSMDYYDRLFGAFQRLHDEGEFEGTGIGLATVSRIVHRHGGEIWAESSPGQGAVFRFTLGGG